MDFQIWMKFFVTLYKKNLNIDFYPTFEILEYFSINVLKNKDSLNEYIMNLINCFMSFSKSQKLYLF
jgi:hypothetical protein